jgi:hypothetical protein
MYTHGDHIRIWIAPMFTQAYEGTNIQRAHDHPSSPAPNTHQPFSAPDL